MKVASLHAALSLKPDRQSFFTANRMVTALKGALVGLVAVKTFDFFRDMFTEVADTADQFNKMAHTVGIASESLQKLEFGAQLSGTSIEVVRNALQRFARSADSANRGSKMSVDAFNELGVSFLDSEGKLRDLEEMLLDAAETISKMPNGTEKTAKAMLLFGRSGAQMLPFLNQGRAGIKAMSQEFEDLGGVISTETGAKFEKFNDDMLRIKTAFRGIKQEIAIALLPIVQDATVGFLDFVKANKDLIRTKIRQFITGLATAVRAVWNFMVKAWEATAPLREAFVELIKISWDLIGGWEGLKLMGSVVAKLFEWQMVGVKALIGGFADLIDSVREYLGLANLITEGLNVPSIEEAELKLIRQGRVPINLGDVPQIRQPTVPTRAAGRRQASNIDARSQFDITINTSEGMDEEEVGRVVRRDVKKEIDGFIRKIDADVLPE